MNYDEQHKFIAVNFLLNVSTGFYVKVYFFLLYLVAFLCKIKHNCAERLSFNHGEIDCGTPKEVRTHRKITKSRHRSTVCSLLFEVEAHNCHIERVYISGVIYFSTILSSITHY